MARGFAHYFKLGEGEKAITVGYSWTVRGGYWRIRFVDPDGKRKEAATGVAKRTKEPTADAHLEAAKIITKAFRPAFPSPDKVTWDDALAEVEKTSTDLRPATLNAYRVAIRTLRKALDADEKIGKKPASPSEVTQEIAVRFAKFFLSEPFARGHQSGAKTYRRKPTTLAFNLRQLSAVWELFRELGYAESNPWKAVRKPQTDRDRKPVPTEEEVNQFFAWVHARYPDWQRLHALLELKALSGCRSLDICQLQSHQLCEGRVVWEAAQVKQRQGRSVKLPAELFGKLRRLAGPTFLWEHFPEDLRRFRPSPKIPKAFDPKTVYWTVSNLFREFNETHPGAKLTPHAFRRRAITLIAMRTQSVDATAQAVGINALTARGYYLDAQRAFDTDGIFEDAADLLLPKTLKPKSE